MELSADELDYFKPKKKTFSKAAQCPRCKQSTLITVARQTRSADEGMTSLVECLSCTYKKKL